MINLNKAMLLAGLAAMGLATPAEAVIMNINVHAENIGGPAFYTAVESFNLPSGFTNASLHITSFGIDDRGTVALNGTVVDSVGLFAPGTGSLVASLGGPNNPYFYAIGDGPRNIFVTGGFVAGLNELLFTVNDTGYGIFGDLAPNGAGGSAYSFNADLSYDVASVPEPATWLTMLFGFGALGVTMRRKLQVMRIKSS
jgi:hypothetical protein